MSGELEKDEAMHRSPGWRRILHSGRALLACGALLITLAMNGCRNESADRPMGPAGADAVTPRASAKEVSTVHPVVEIETNLGAITARLDAVKAPLAVRNFVDYVNDGFYSNTLIHYVTADQMIIGGGYTADGTPKHAGPPIRNEAHNGLKNLRGTIAMARDVAAGTDSASSQFFINLTDAPALDHHGQTSEEYGYCVFGEVVDGLEVAERISRSPTRDGGGDLAQTPDPPVIVESVHVVR
jgi:cyclophilin family peptidyl-prolyl cis-trans isomerase